MKPKRLFGFFLYIYSPKHNRNEIIFHLNFIDFNRAN